jgi:hypothetical protein
MEQPELQVQRERKEIKGFKVSKEFKDYKV